MNQSSSAYLCKYGGRRGQVALYLEKLRDFKSIRVSNAKDTKKFADILDIAVITLKEAGRRKKLGNGSLYDKLQRKMTETMLTQYYRWIFKHKKQQYVEGLRQQVIQEAEFQTVHAETLRGIWSNCSTAKRNQPFLGQTRSLAGNPNKWPRKSHRTLKVCGNNYPFGATSFKV